MSMTICPSCGEESGVTHGDQLFTSRMCAVCNKTHSCPICSKTDSCIDMALHLMQDHDWDYGRAQEWLRGEQD